MTRISQFADLPSDVQARIRDVVAPPDEDHWLTQTIPALGGRSFAEAIGGPDGLQVANRYLDQVEKWEDRKAPDPAPLPEVARGRRRSIYCGGLTWTNAGIPLYSLPPLVCVRIDHREVSVGPAHAVFGVAAASGVVLAMTIWDYTGFIVAFVVALTYLGMPRMRSTPVRLVAKRGALTWGIWGVELSDRDGSRRRGLWGTNPDRLMEALVAAGVSDQESSNQ